MKRVPLTLLVMVMLLTACAKPQSGIKADDIAIYYGFSSYAMFGADQAVIDDLLYKFSALSFEKTKAELDIGSAFHVVFSYKGKVVKKIWADQNSVFWLDGETQCYTVSSGSFDYAHLKTIYEDSRK